MSDPFATSYFSSLSSELRRRAARALAGKLNPASASLRQYLVRHGDLTPGEPGSFLADPVFEATFPWTPGAQTLAQMAGSQLSAALVDALDAAKDDLAFPRHAVPYEHQVRAWSALRADQSIVVTSGTSSGKTECYLLPILDDLIGEAAERSLVGVRALFLYPLNALINSQRDRMRAWSEPLGGRVRFCLYNGETPEDIPAREESQHREEVRSRSLLRKNPPPILVTNATMLEYMLVRQQDRPILAASQGKLRWIVLDEAHSYLGSQAADVALLLRRVLHAFGVTPEQVRFVATSATIRSGRPDEATQKLQSYLADMTGLPEGRITVIPGQRSLPALPAGCDALDEPLPADLEALAAMSPEDRFLPLVAAPGLRAARAALGERPRTLPEIARLLLDLPPDRAVSAAERQRTVATLDLARGATWEGRSLLPLRGHFFQRTQGGLWACVNRECAGRAAAQLAQDWPFGALYHERQTRCTACQALVLPVALCATCGTEYLLAIQESREGEDFLAAVASLSAEDAADGDAQEEDDDAQDGAQAAPALRYLIQSAERPLKGKTQELFVDLSTGLIKHSAAPGLQRLAAQPQDGTDDPQCHRCREHERSPETLFRPVRAGGPFFLSVSTPTLLEHVPPSAARNARPLEGRKALTFTDSRQGTARFATMAQTDAERGAVRAWLYHQTWAAAETVDPAKLAELAQEIAQLKAIPKSPIIDKLISERQAALDKLTAIEARLPWSKAAALLADTQMLRWMCDLWKNRGSGPMDLQRAAQFCLYREFLRRPKRSNSLESLGLVQLRYPDLDGVDRAPTGWPLGLPAWRSFLHLCLDFFVRTHTAVQVEPEFLRWMGVQITARMLVAPDVAGEKRQIPFSQIRIPTRPPGMALLLLRALSLDAAVEGDRDLVNHLLWEAFRSLQRTGVLRQEADGLRLDLQRAELVAPQEVYRCPLTYGALPTTLAELTPYLTKDIPLAEARCAVLRLPRPPAPFVTARPTALAWLESEPLIAAARAAGLWRELSDRIAAGSDYYQVGEHSAQQSSARLKQLEKAFKDGFVNVLSCSTTMEMGVDIGGISAVAMNNAPPGPANFLQRAGRAGRRTETASVSLTLCKAMPHGEAVFHNPLWPFTTPIAVPTVSLQSERIVQRHVNALALNCFLLESDSLSIDLNAGAFFGDGTQDSTPAARFIAWLTDDRRAPDLALKAGVERICARSCLAGLGLSAALARCAAEMTATQGRWLGERMALRAEWSAAAVTARKDPTPAQLALARLLERLDGEYLLALLSSSRFLPGHGFPTGVIPFVTSTIEQLRREERERKERNDDQMRREREDSGFRRRGYPCRDVGMAIREYAPGTTVVLDGQVYRSGGVTLNWHIPAGDLVQPQEPQSFRVAFRCRACGASGDRATALEECPSCRTSGPLFTSLPYLEPTGFAVEIYYEPTNDLSGDSYVPVRRPWISAGGVPFLSLPRADLGRYRYNPNGHIFQYSAGVNHHGYAICLRCGRAVSEPAGQIDPTELPPGMEAHKPLRGGKERSQSSGKLCSGCDDNGRFSIKRGQRLGVAAETDVFELQLREPTSGALLRSESAAFSIAVALRQALAEHLGIEDRELGCDAALSRYAGDARGYSILLFDTAAGGAGYVARAGSELAALLRRAREILACPHRGCDRACHGCLLSFDTQYYMELLDRQAALAFLTDALLAGFALPESLRCFGATSRMEFAPLREALLRALQSPDAKALRLYVGGDPQLWDPAFWPLRADLLRLTAIPGACPQITVIAPGPVLDALPPETASSLASLLESAAVALHRLDDGAADPAVPLLIAEVVGAEDTQRWAAQEPPWLVLGEDWAGVGDGQQALCVYGKRPQITPPRGTPVELSRLRRAQPGTYREVSIPRQLRLPVGGMIHELWRRLTEAVPEVRERLQRGARLKQVEYHDRYLRSPLTVRLLAEFLRHLKDCGLDGSTQLTVVTTEGQERQQGRHFAHDWAYDRDRDEVLRQTFAALGLPLRYENLARRETMHTRQLHLRWEDGASWIVRLDQGLGFLQAVGDQPFPFGKTAEEQARVLLQRATQVEPRDSLPGLLYAGPLVLG